MRFFADGPALPDELLEAQARGETLFLCGAGVSMCAGLPSFLGLADAVAHDLGMSRKTALRTRLAAALAGDSAPPSLDGVFEDLKEEYGDRQVEAKVTARLRPRPNVSLQAHQTILRLSRDANGRTRVLTTNFDSLFERAGSRLRVHSAPILPELRDDHPLEGVVHLHGCTGTRARAGRVPLILSAADFGRAYLAEGWATRFMRDVLARYVVVLVGYSAEDPPINYLLQGLRSLRVRSRRPIYAFAAGAPAEVDAGWRRRDVEAIAYDAKDHAHVGLWSTLEAWAGAAIDPSSWRRSVLEKAQLGPRALAPHERGQVAALIKSADGARAFARTEPPPPAEWLCVFDSGLRYEKPAPLSYEVREEFDPLIHYGLDDDPPRPSSKPRSDDPIGPNLLAALPSDPEGLRLARLAGWWVRRAAPLSTRLQALTPWIAANWASSATLWWAAAYQGTLHPDLLERIDQAIRREGQTGATDAIAAWRLIQEVRPPGPLTAQRMDILERVRMDGWARSTLRSFAEAIRPRLTVERAYFGRYGVLLEPKASRRATSPIDFDVDWFGDVLMVPPATGAALVGVVREVREALRVGASMLADIGNGRDVRTPSIVADDGPGERAIDACGHFFLWFTRLFSQLVEESTDAARHELAAWPLDEDIFFEKLRVWAQMHVGLTDGPNVGAHLLSLPDRSFWDPNMQRELLHTLRARWSEMGPTTALAIERRIRRGRPQRQSGNGDARHFQRVAFEAANFLSWLTRNECVLSDESEHALPILKALSGSDRAEWGGGADLSFEGRTGWVEPIRNPSVLLGLKLSEVVSRCAELAGHRPSDFTRLEPFEGLVEQHPLRALAVLSFEARRGVFPTALWSTLLMRWPTKQLRDRAHYTLGMRLAALPIAELASIGIEGPRWLARHHDCIDAYRSGSALNVWDALSSSVMAGHDEETIDASSIRLDDAVNSCAGELTQVLLALFDKLELSAGTTMPADFSERFGACLSARGAHAARSAAVMCRALPALATIAPAWSAETVLPHLMLEHENCAAAWSGLLFSNHALPPAFFEMAKPSFLAAVSRGDQWPDAKATPHVGVTLCESICWRPGRRAPTLVSASEGRAALQAASPEVRHATLAHLSRLVMSKSDWSKTGARFLRDVWPLERQHQTSETADLWVRIATRTPDAFAEIAKALIASPVLVPVKELEMILLGWTRSKGGAAPIAQRHARETLALLDAVYGEAREWRPSGLPAVLDLIAEGDVALRQDSRWLRLEMARRA